MQLGTNDDLIYGMEDAAGGLMIDYAKANKGSLPEVSPLSATSPLPATLLWLAPFWHKLPIGPAALDSLGDPIEGFSCVMHCAGHYCLPGRCVGVLLRPGSHHRIHGHQAGERTRTVALPRGTSA